MIINHTNPGMEPVDGDWIEIQHISGAIEKKTYYTPVITPEVIHPMRILSHREFLKRLTAAEFKSIRQAAKTNADVDMFMYLFERSQTVDLDDADTAAGIQMLEAGGLLAAGRAVEILV